MPTNPMNRRLIITAGLVVLVLLGAGIYFFHGNGNGGGGSGLTTAPDNLTFTSGRFTITYPKLYTAHEYAQGVVSLGGSQKGTDFIPLIDVVEYKSDLQSATPASFDAFVRKQAQSLCGSDTAGETITCTNPVETPYLSASGLHGTQLSLTLTRKNSKTGAVSTSTYGPIFVFNTSTTPGPGEKARYQGVFVYPTFSTFLLAPGAGELVKDIAAVLIIK